MTDVKKHSLTTKENPTAVRWVPLDLRVRWVRPVRRGLLVLLGRPDLPGLLGLLVPLALPGLLVLWVLLGRLPMFQ